MIQIASATMPDDGRHNQSLVSELVGVHALVPADVVVFDLGADAKGTYSIAYEVGRRGAVPIRLPEYARLG